MTHRPTLLDSLLKAALMAATLLTLAEAQNPIPQIVGPVHPDAVPPGGPAFTLSVYGANFVPGSIVNWNYQPRTTTYISGHEIQAQILDTDIATNTAGYITVTNPAPGGGFSSASWAQVEVHNPISIVAMKAPAYFFFGFAQLGISDINQDAALDLLGDSSLGLAVELGIGTGGFQSAHVVDSTDYSPREFGIGDFNGDGLLDVVAPSELGVVNFEPDRMDVLFGEGAGDFSRGPSFTSPIGDLNWIRVGDFNQDGMLDLVTTGGVSISTYLGNGDGTFNHANHASYPGYGLGAGTIAGDFDGDGKLDLILTQTPWLSFTAYDDPGIAFWFLKGNGDGTFQPIRKLVAFPNDQPCVGGNFSDSIVQFSDFNGDGKLDLAFCNQGQIGVMLGNGDGTFRPATFTTIDSTGQGLFTFAIGDLNSDGKPDLIVSDYPNDVGSTFYVLPGNGNGTFQPKQVVASGFSLTAAESGIKVGDFNSSGLSGVIFLNSGLGMDVYLPK